MNSVKKIYFSWLSKWAIALLIFSLCRFLFYLFNYSYFTDIDFNIFWGGLRFDWMTITLLYSPFLLAHLIDFKGKSKILKVLFHLSNSLAIAFNCMDLEYFKFTFKRTTSDLFVTAGIENDILNLLPAFLKDYWYVVLIALLLIWLSEYLYHKTERFEPNWPGLGKYTAFLIPVIVLYFIGFRGGLQYKPLNVIQAGQYAEAQNIPLVLNTPFTIIKSATKEDLSPVNYFPDEEVDNYYSPLLKLKVDSIHKPLNVVLIIAESFSKEYIGAFNDYKGYTPFLDRLIDKSYVVENTFANGKKSIEALPAILSGIPTLMNTAYISSKYGSNRIESIGSKLKEKGYRTAFYHGGENGTMGFNAFTKIAEIEEYIGRDQYPHSGDYDGNWGIFDEPFLQFCVEDLSKNKKPFFAGIFTLSSHHPYTVPEKYSDKFKGGPLPILKSVEYADYALQQFFESAEKEDWFNNTLFVITADHTSQTFKKAYNNRMGMFAIPLIFYAPKHISPARLEKVSQQNDIFPSIMDYLGDKEEILTFGQSVFNSEEGFSVSYINQVYQLIEGDFCLQFDGEESIAFYHWKEDPGLHENLIKGTKFTQEKKRMEQKLKAIIQQYNKRMIQNQLIP
ncbi:MAG: sulfatase-like hydrolase/transferase [Vicingaceae bacterium]